MSELSKKKFLIESTNVDDFNNVRTVAENHLTALLENESIEHGKTVSKKIFVFQLKKNIGSGKKLQFPVGTKRNLNLISISEQEMKLVYEFEVSDITVILNLTLEKNSMLPNGIEF